MKTRIMLMCLALLLLTLLPVPAGADSLFNRTMRTHYVALAAIPNTTTTVYSTSVWLKSVEFIPQSNTNPTCTVQDGAGNYAYNAVSLSANHSYRDERTDTSPLFMSGGITWSCSDTTVKGQLIVLY